MSRLHGAAWIGVRKACADAANIPLAITAAGALVDDVPIGLEITVDAEIALYDRQAAFDELEDALTAGDAMFETALAELADEPVPYTLVAS